MKTSYLKTIIRTIKNSLGRFLAILAIIALGVGFYSGLVLTEPCFVATGRDFIDDYNLYDLRLLSTIGFTEDDITEISSITGVDVVEGAFFTDAITIRQVGSVVEDDIRVVRFHSMTEDVNCLKLLEGRLPVSPNEVVVDGFVCPSSFIGNKLIMAPDNSDDTLDSVNTTEFTIVGTVRSPYYMNFQRGTTNVGNGALGYYAYVLPEVFESEYFSEAYVFLNDRAQAYSDEYDQLIDAVTDIYEPQLQLIVEDRLGNTIADAREEYNDAYADFVRERDDAWQELQDGYSELVDARLEIIDARQQLNDAEVELRDSRRELDDAIAELEEGEAELNRRSAELESNYTELTNGIATAEATRSELVSQLGEVNSTISELQTSITMIEAGIAQINGNLPYINDPATSEAMNEQLAELNTNLVMATAGLSQAESGKVQLEAGISQVDSTLDELNSLLVQLEAGRAQIAEARNQIEEGRSEIASYERQYNEGLEEYEEGLADFESGLDEYNDGRREYYNGLSEYQREIAFANRELEYANRKLKEAEDLVPDTYVLDRNTNVGYVCFESDSQIVSGIARVFPVFFFAIAALVCSTTMQRMVNDERTYIGTMKAMGYTDFAIVMKYVVYSGLAATIGAIGGFAGGIKLFPAVIWNVYGMMYGFSPVSFVTDWGVFTLALLVSLICSVGVTIVTAVGELRGMPAELIRPKAPAAGKRILLERMTFIWNKLGFLIKISARNVFRFKKRMFMMIIGIAGCTALLVTGFGLRNSISDIVATQYERILSYDLSFVFEEDYSKAEILSDLEELNNRLGVDSESVFVHMSPVKHNGDDAIRDVYLISSDDPNINRATHIVVDGEEMPWPEDNKIAISSKLAAKNNLNPGDMVTFEYGDNGETFTIEIQYVFDNYIYHYAFMNANTYEVMFGERYIANTVFVIRDGVNFDEATGISDSDYGAQFANSAPVKSWSAVDDSIASFSQTMSKMDAVIILIIASSGALAFIVLFNLNNINITERIREIATLKVLGFNRYETGSYVFRENFILVFMGYVVGAPLGVALNQFVVSQIEMDMVTFIIKVLPMSYVYALLFVILFSLIVNLIIRAKIERIDMAESLKSIE